MATSTSTGKKRGRPKKVVEPVEKQVEDEVVESIEEEMLEDKVLESIDDALEETTVDELIEVEEEVGEKEVLDDGVDEDTEEKGFTFFQSDYFDRLGIKVQPAPTNENDIVKIAVITDMKAYTKYTINLVLRLAEWRDKVYPNKKKYYAVMQGPNGPLVSKFAHSKNCTFQPERIHWGNGRTAVNIAYDHMIRQLDKNSTLIIMYSKETGLLKSAKKLAEMRGVPVMYLNMETFYEIVHGKAGKSALR